MRKAVLSGLAMLLTLPLSADVLVTRDGSRVEIDGSWEVKGRQVVFTLPNGTLSAMRASEVDLEASRLATEQLDAPPPAEPAPEPPREAVLVLTDKDIPRGAPEPEAASAEGEPLKAPLDREPVQVVNWVRNDLLDGIEIRGMLTNLGRNIAANISLQIQVKNEEGQVSETANAAVKTRSLGAGSSTSFRAILTQVPDFVGEPVFTISSKDVTLGGAKFATGQQAGSQTSGEAGAESTSGGGAGTSAAGGGPSGAGTQGGAATGANTGGAGSGEGRVPPSQVNPPVAGPGYEDDSEPAEVDSNG